MTGFACAESAMVRIQWGKNGGRDTRVETRHVEMAAITEGGWRFVLPKEQIPVDAETVDVVPSFMTARTGDDDYWMQARGTYGRFTAKEGTYSMRRQLMPIYGVKRGTSMWWGHVKTWRFDYDFMTVVKKETYETFPRFRCDKVHRFFKDYYNDIVIEFHRLEGSEADYNGLARAYRAYQLKRNAVKTIKERLHDQPELDYLCDAIVVRIQTHAMKPIPDKRDGFTQVDFEPGKELPVQVHMPFCVGEEYLQAFKDAGIDKLSFCLLDGVMVGTTVVCPVTSQSVRKQEARRHLGGLFRRPRNLATSSLSTAPTRMATRVRRCGTMVPTLAGRERGNATWVASGGGGRCYWICQKCAWDHWTRTEMDRLSAMGIRGPHYIDVYSATYPARCNNPDHVCTPEQMAEYQNRILAYARKTFGCAASESGYDHVVGNLDYINYIERDLKLEHEGKFAGTLVSGIFPVWELVYHGIVLYTSDRLCQNHTRGKCMFKLERSGDPRWMIGDGVEDPYTALKIIEFGGRPIFYTYKFADVPRVKRAWDEFVPVRYLQREGMVSHREVAQGVFETCYEDGSRTICNYNAQEVLGVPSMGYTLHRADGTTYSRAFKSR